MCEAEGTSYTKAQRLSEKASRWWGSERRLRSREVGNEGETCMWWRRKEGGNGPRL